jgi:polyisoprenoid-binding protein YceI
MRVAATALAVCLALAAPWRDVSEAAGAEVRAIDTANSRAQFSITHVFVEHVTGTVPILSGSVALSSGSSLPAGATAVLDATMLATGDSDQTAALRSPDFFDVKRFPTWTFASTRVTPEGPSTFGMDGNLTIHGVTQPEHLEVSVTGDAAHPHYHATTRIDRHAFGMSVTRLDPAIGGIADVTLDVTLK